MALWNGPNERALFKLKFHGSLQFSRSIRVTSSWHSDVSDEDASDLSASSRACRYREL